MTYRRGFPFTYSAWASTVTLAIVIEGASHLLASSKSTLRTEGLGRGLSGASCVKIISPEMVISLA